MSSSLVAAARGALPRFRLPGDQSRVGPIALSLGVLVVVSLLVVPVPPFLLDILLAFSLSLSLVILILTVFIRSALDFSSFPTVLLIATTYRLALNVGSTRLILAEGHSGTASAGRVIEAFGHFVMGDSVVIGAIVFSVLLIINFIVITKGSGRIAEVGARFTLDALPGKQMAIDADLSAGLVNEAEARARRRTLEEESSFYGAMDGASKFVKGDAIAGIVIILINIVGGLIIGVGQKGLGFAAALKTYTILTIGDGLVAQVPGLIVATAAGLIITKTGATERTDSIVSRQFAAHPDSLLVAASIVMVLGLVPGMPTVLFLAVAAAMGGVSLLLRRPGASERTEGGALLDRAGPAGQPGAEPAPLDPEAEIADDLRIDDVRLEIGYGILAILRQGDDSAFVAAFKNLRRKMAKDLGVVIPAIRVQDNIQLDDDEYAIFIKEHRIAGGRLRGDHLLALNPRDSTPAFPAERTSDPTFGIPALWVERSQRAAAEAAGFSVVEPLTVLVTHLSETVRRHLDSLISFAATQKLIDRIGEEHHKLVQTVIPASISVAGVQAVLRGLLREHVSVRNLPEIIEAAAEAAPRARDFDDLVEHVRRRLRRSICLQLAERSEGRIHALVYVPRAAETAEEPSPRTLSGAEAARLLEGLTSAERKRGAVSGLVLVVPDGLRPFVSEIVRRQGRGAAVLGQGEIDEAVEVVVEGRI